MNNTKYLTEAFKSLDLLTEADTFNLSDANSFDDMAAFKDKDDIDIVDIIDTDAETENDIKSSYIGNIILDCPVCHSKVFKKPDEVEISEEDDLANIEEECPYCLSVKGFKIIGKICPFSDDVPEVKVDDELVAVDDEETELQEGKICKKCGKNPCECDKDDLDESFEKVEVDTDTQHMKMTQDASGKVVVETEPINDLPMSDDLEPGDEMITPVDAEDVNDINANSEEEEPEMPAEPAGEEPVEDDDTVEFDLDDFDEDSFNELSESYLKNVYDNVNSFKVKNVNMPTEDSIIVEGVINFNSGTEKPTSFVFNRNYATNKNSVTLTGYNEQLSRGKKSFKLNCKVSGSKLISESLNYNYRAKDFSGKPTRIYGTVKC